MKSWQVSAMTSTRANRNNPLPRLSDDLWRNVCGGPANSVQQAIYGGGQAEVGQLQRFAAILVFAYLENKGKKLARCFPSTQSSMEESELEPVGKKHNTDINTVNFNTSTRHRVMLTINSEKQMKV